MGTAAGIALIGTVFFAVATTSGQVAGATMALRIAAAVISVALIASAVDLRTRRREGRVAPASKDAGQPAPRHTSPDA
jgi:hypothetical protein